MERKFNGLINKIIPLIGVQVSMLGINLNKDELVHYKRPLNIPKFVDFLPEDKNLKTESKYPSEYFRNQDVYRIQNLYETVNEKPSVYSFENGKIKLISGTESKQSPKEYLTQKLLAIKALKNQIEFGNN
jgi:hypothetical protein